MTTNKKIAAVAGIVGGMIAAATSASAALNLPTQSCSYNFTVNMKKGTKNAQVMDLQKVLNNYPQTTVALSGVGSKGMETNFYGAATAKAVAKFQELHAAETLSPIGATKGTGNAFALTRAVLNQICNGGSPVVVVPGTGTVVNGSVVASLTAGQPNQVIVATQAAARLADFTFSGNGTVTSVNLMRTGISNNDTLKNVYLYEGATRLTDAASVSINGNVNFNSSVGLFTVNGSSRTITVRADVASSTSGQSVGMALTGYTTMGASSSVVMLAGNNQPIANVTLAGLSLTNQTSVANGTLNIPQTNYNVWGTTVSVASRAVVLKSLAVKMIGSAPVNAVANVQLYVDGVAAGSAVADMNQRFTFAPNKSLSTGAHTLEVRADVVSGSNRNFYFTLENEADILAEDSQVTGANVSLSTGFVAYRQGASQSISFATNTSVTLATDPTFVASNLVSGATNQTIAKYRLTAFGEDTKIQNISVRATSSSDLTNVALYVNGVQIGSNQNVVTGTPKQFTLGSNFIATAGVAYTVEVRGDLINAAGLNLTGNVVAIVEAISGQGESSKNAFGPVSPAVTPRTLTIGGGDLSIGNTIGAVNTTVSANSNVKIASFSIQGGSVEAVTLRTLVLGLTGTVPTNLISNITLTDEAGTVLGNPSGVSSASQTYSPSNGVSVAIGQTKTVNVMANIGAAANGTTIIPTMTVSFTGVASNQSSTTAVTTGTTVTIGNIAVNNPTVSSKVAANYVLGGLSKQVIVYNFTSTNGSATLNDATFAVTGNGVQSITMNGKTANVIGSTATFFGVNLAIPAGNNGVNSPVTVNFTPAYVGTGNGVLSGATNSIALTGTKTTDQSGNVVASTTLPATLNANTQTLVASIPTVNAVANSGTNSGNGTNVKLGTISVKADVAGDIVVGKLAYTAASAGTTVVNAVKVNGSTAQDKSGVNGVVTAGDVTFTNGYRITAGTTVVFEIYGTVSGVTTAASVTSVALGANANFLWSDDATTVGTANTGTLLSSANYNN